MCPPKTRRCQGDTVQAEGPGLSRPSPGRLPPSPGHQLLLKGRGMPHWGTLAGNRLSGSVQSSRRETRAQP